MSDRRNGSKKSFSRKFIGIDLFGRPISFEYDGDIMYKTGFGAWLTLLLTFSILAFVAVRI